MIDRVMLYFSFHDVVDGLKISAFVDRKESTAVLANVRQAIELLKSTDAYRYRRVVRRLGHVLVAPTPIQGEYAPVLRRCVLSKKMALAGEIRRIAVTLVHEATHAELFDRGIGYGLEIRARVEDVCARQELAFGRKLPEIDDLLEESEERLMLPDDTWSDENLVQHQLALMEQEGTVPKWLLRVGIAYREWRLRRAGVKRSPKSESAA